MLRAMALSGSAGDFYPPIPDDAFYRVQAILAGRVYTTGPHQRRRPEFPLRAFIKCAACGRGVTASWSKGRNGRYADRSLRAPRHAGR